MKRNPLGSGWTFPVKPDARTGALTFTEGTDKVRQSILLILETDPGERIMLPSFGCGLRRYLMKPNTAAVRALIQRDVERALKAWEPRIRVESVSVDEGDDPAMVLIRIAYQHLRDGRQQQMAYSYSLE